MLILIGVILILVFVIGMLAAWTFLGWFLWIILVAGIVLIVIRLMRRRKR